MSSRLDNLRDALDRLKQRLAAGEIDEATFDRLRDRIVGDLSPDERSALGVTPTPRPVPPTGSSPYPGTPTPVGPSGGVRGGLRTARASLADLDLGPGAVLLGQWKLIRELGRGGFGAVFEAEELSLGERHAVKVLDPAMVAKEELLARFRREVSLMRKLVHPRIVRVYDYREDLQQNLALISMELVAEGSVKQLLSEAKRRGEPIPLPLALNVLGQILEALAEAHGQGVIHRDVTPGNVLLAGGMAEVLLTNPERDPRVKLVDFGIAGLVERTELSAKSRVLGTAAYVAPEVLDPSVEVTPQADVYGAGAIGYELVTGHLPVGRFDEPIELRPELGKELNRYLLALLSTRPEGRPTAGAAAAGLREVRAESTRRRVQEAEQKAREREQARQRELEAQRRAEAEAAARERLEQEAQLRERQEAERRQVEAERRSAAERERKAEQDRLAGEARRSREAAPTPARPHPSMEAVSRKSEKRGPSPTAWLGILALVAAVVAGIGWGLAQQREAERQRQVAEQQRQATIAEEQRKAREAMEAERRRQAQLLEQEKQKAAAAATQAERERIAREQEEARQAERERIAREQEEAKQAEAARVAQQQREEQAARRAEEGRKADAAAEQARQAEAARRAEEERKARERAASPAGIEWVRIPGGSFTMGCTSGDPECYRDEKPPHRVTVRSFELAATETTVAQYGKCLSAGRCSAVSSPSFSQDASHPVVNVDWNQARSFCSWAGGRLPSEAEWEFAARGGQSGWKYPWGSSISHENANYSGTGGRDRWNGTAPVKSFASNGYGLYDMSGNVWEWVEDTWHDNYSGAPSDGSAWTSGGNSSQRVLRGGSWGSLPRLLRVSIRDDAAPDHRGDHDGFRCARMGN